MKRIDIENGLGILAFGVVLAGVFFAAESAFADDAAASDEPRVQQVEQAPRKDSTEKAPSDADQHAEMAREAADSIRESNVLDLDIQLRNHISTVDARF